MLSYYSSSRRKHESLRKNPWPSIQQASTKAVHLLHCHPWSRATSVAKNILKADFHPVPHVEKGLLLCWKSELCCTYGRIPVRDVTAGVSHHLSDQKNLLWHHWLGRGWNTHLKKTFNQDTCSNSFFSLVFLCCPKVKLGGLVVVVGARLSKQAIHTRKVKQVSYN